MEQLTGVKSTVDLEPSQNLKTPKGVSCAPKQNQITFGNQSLRKVGSRVKLSKINFDTLHIITLS